MERSPKKGRSGAAGATSMEAISNSVGSNIRNSAAFTSSAATTPTSPMGDDFERNKHQVRKPIGGIAVLPPMDMKNDDRSRTPNDAKSRPFSQTSTRGQSTENSEVCKIF